MTYFEELRDAIHKLHGAMANRTPPEFALVCLEEVNLSVLRLPFFE
jgi:hypothetical protein